MAVSFALLLQTGAVSVLLVGGDDGIVGFETTILRLMALPGYTISLIILARYPEQFLSTLQRNIPVVLLLSLPLLSVFWSISPSITLRRAIALLLSLMMAYVLAMRFTPRQLLVLLTAVIGATMVLSLLAGATLPGLAYMPDGPELRGVFNHKNVLGWYAALGILTSGMLATDRGLGLRPLAGLVLVASIVCLALSESVTALASVFSALVFTVFYLLLRRSGTMGRAFLILLALQLMALLILSLGSVVPTVLEGLDKDTSLTGRVPLWALVDEAISQRPMLGYGYQSFWTDGSVGAWSIWTKVAWFAPHAHSGYRDALLSFGFVGTGLLVVVSLRAVYQGGTLFCRQPQGAWLWLNVMVAVFLVMNITESKIYAQNDFLFLMFITAVLMFSGRKP